MNVNDVCFDKSDFLIIFYFHVKLAFVLNGLWLFNLTFRNMGYFTYLK